MLSQEKQDIILMDPNEERLNFTNSSMEILPMVGNPTSIRDLEEATIVLAKDYKDKAGDALIKELQDHVKKITAPYKYPRVVEFVDELPKTISGKIRRVEIRTIDNEKRPAK